MTVTLKTLFPLLPIIDRTFFITVEDWVDPKEVLCLHLSHCKLPCSWSGLLASSPLKNRYFSGRLSWGFHVVFVIFNMLPLLLLRLAKQTTQDEEEQHRFLAKLPPSLLVSVPSLGPFFLYLVALTYADVSVVAKGVGLVCQE